MNDAPAPPIHPIDDADALTQLTVALTIEIDKLPQLKGKGAIVGAEARGRAVKILAEALFNRLKRGNLVFGRAPAEHATAGIGKDSVAIPFGSPPRFVELEAVPIIGTVGESTDST